MGPLDSTCTAPHHATLRLLGVVRIFGAGGGAPDAAPAAGVSEAGRRRRRRRLRTLPLRQRAKQTQV
jgi:hypothetical protein